MVLIQKAIGVLKKRLSRALNETDTGIEQLSANGDAFVKFLNEKAFYASLIIKFEKKILFDEESGENVLLVEPILDILQKILIKGSKDKTLRSDIATKELVTILWSQMLGILNTLSGKQEILNIYGVNRDWIIKGHYRVIMSGLAANAQVDDKL